MQEPWNNSSTCPLNDQVKRVVASSFVGGLASIYSSDCAVEAVPIEKFEARPVFAQSV